MVEGGDKPRTASLFSSMEPATLDAGAGAAAAADPAASSGRTPRRTRTSWPTTGRFGPYLKRGADTRSLGSEEQLLDRDPARGAGAVRPAQAAPGPGVGRAAARAGHRPDHQPARRRQGRPLRPLRDRRHHQRQPAQGRRRGVHRHGARVRAAGRAPGRRPLDRARRRRPRRPRRPRRRRRRRRPPAKKAAAKKAAAKKTAAAKKAAGAKKAAPTEPF